MKLVYHTRGNAGPQGKPRVYFTGHPTDLPAYSDEIFTDILKTQNCAIYYDQEPEAPCDTEGLLHELEQMQLIVIPVTSRFLYQPNRAREVEFPFAMEHHIPVLPLMQEQGLESVFNEKCGDLQVLNKSDPDPTALPFSEKLEKFLASVLVGDELAEKVRAAFDAYVFLSYRKKDRKYAQELMRLIHKNDFCRDIAIWYDEFLTPGENFNEAIADAMAKCQLFTLAVTPNVVEPGNYVMRLEYPEARRAGKPILPVELVRTDKETLQSSFPDIPPCADAYNESALSAALLMAVQRLAIKENDGSPEHNFFIGLAYLNGIDVEVDRERALDLIIGAAENGLPEAMEKLVHMYRSGDGVAQDYYTAIRWQKKLADWCRMQFEEHESKENGLVWINSLWLLGDYHSEQANLADAERIYQKMLEISTKLANLHHDIQTKRSLFACYNKLGNINRGNGRLAEARKFYLQSLELCGQLYKETETEETKRDLCVSYNMMGEISKAEGKLSEAKEYYIQGLEISSELCQETETADTRCDLAFSYDKLGDVCRAEDRLSEANDYYLRSLELHKQLSEEIGTAIAKRDLASSYASLGNLKIAEGQLANARNYFLQELELGRQIYEEVGTIQAMRDLSACYSRLGDVSKLEGKPAETKDYYAQSLGFSKKLYNETGSLFDQRYLSIGYLKLAWVLVEGGRKNEALACQAEAYRLCDELTDRTDSVSDLKLLAIISSDMSAMIEENPQLKRSLLEQSCNIWNKLRTEHPDVPEYTRGYDMTRKKLAQL